MGCTPWALRYGRRSLDVRISARQSVRRRLAAGRQRIWRHQGPCLLRVRLRGSAPGSAPGVRGRVDRGAYRWILSRAARRSAPPFACFRSTSTMGPERLSVRPGLMKHGAAPGPGDFDRGRASGSVVWAWVASDRSPARKSTSALRNWRVGRGSGALSDDVGAGWSSVGPGWPPGSSSGGLSVAFTSRPFNAIRAFAQVPSAKTCASETRAARPRDGPGSPAIPVERFRWFRNRSRLLRRQWTAPTSKRRSQGPRTSGTAGCTASAPDTGAQAAPDAGFGSDRPGSAAPARLR